jgi:hypothetical protein
MKAILWTPLLLLCVLVCAADDKTPEPKEKDKQPAPKLPVGRDTTYVTGPFDKYGYIDYEAALNAELSKNVTPETNAMVLLIQVLGPAPEGGDGLPPAYFKWLDMPLLPKEGNYFLGQGTYITGQLGITGEKLEKLYEVQSWATQRPWEPKDAPPLVEWLKVNEKQLALVSEAVKRKEYFNPLASKRKEGESSNLIGVLLPSVQKCRELATSFVLRAMLRIKEGKFEEAWADILTCHRLGRLVGRGATLIEGLVGIAICQIASNASITYLAHANLTSKQALACLKDLESLPPIPSMADKIDVSERMMGLDALQMIRRGQGNGLYLDDGPTFTKEEVQAWQKVGWSPTMRAMNKWYDRMAAAMRMKDRAAREKEFDKIDEALREGKKNVAKLAELKKPPKDKEAEKMVTESLGVVLMSLLSPAIRKVQSAHDRGTQVANNTHVAFAMAAYRADNGKYPAELRDLAPKYLATVPGDIFNGKPLIYKPSGKGYLFYSVGPNGKDENGHWYDDVPPGDDPRVKLPLPELKKK